LTKTEYKKEQNKQPRKLIIAVGLIVWFSSEAFGLLLAEISENLLIAPIFKWFENRKKLLITGHQKY